MNRREFVQLPIGLSTALAFPALSANQSDSPKKWRLEAGEIQKIFEPEQPEPAHLLGFNGMTPGPVIRIPQGKMTEVLVTNKLTESTSVHWHGLRHLNAMDGVPGMTQPPIEPGNRFNYVLNPPDAGTYWYHSHQRSWEQIAKGLAGVLIVEEPEPQDFDQDLVFALDDWRLDDDLQLDEGSFGSLHDWAHAGRLGNYLTVNGRTLPQFDVVSGQRVRLRVVNIANARVMTLRFPAWPTWTIAKDGQPITPVLLENNTLTLAPGQRVDLAIDLTDNPGSNKAAEVLVRDQVIEVADFIYHPENRMTARANEPVALPDNPLQSKTLPPAGEFLSVPFKIEGGAMGRMPDAIYKGESMGVRELARQGQVWAINGFVGMTEQPLFSVKRGTAVRLEVNNNNAWPHGIHVHGHHFRDSRDPAAWRDTALFNRMETGNLEFIADNPGVWMIHCHMLEHQASGMKAWFKVT